MVNLRFFFIWVLGWGLGLGIGVGVGGGALLHMSVHVGGNDQEGDAGLTLLSLH